VTIGINVFSRNGNVLGKFLHIKVKWKTSPQGDTGSTQSPVFTMTTSSADVQRLEDLLAEHVRQNPNAGKDIDTSDGAGIVGAGSPSGLIGATPTTSLPTSTSASTLQNPSATSPTGTIDSGIGIGGGGLSTGAIAGIAVGCALVGIALIGFLVWFLVFRRRRDTDHVAEMAYTSDGRTGPHDFMMEKETHAVAAESPHSPYSDDGQLRERTMIPQSPPVMPHDHSSFSPYSDAGGISGAQQHHEPYDQPQHDQHDISRQQDARSATPQGIPTTVAHLVEEGMTQEQIRRLEEEERALDEDIERAGRR
jgi:hypothetical protein